MKSSKGAQNKAITFLVKGLLKRFIYRTFLAPLYISAMLLITVFVLFAAEGGAAGELLLDTLFRVLVFFSGQPTETTILEGDDFVRGLIFTWLAFFITLNLAIEAVEYFLKKEFSSLFLEVKVAGVINTFGFILFGFLLAVSNQAFYPFVVCCGLSLLSWFAWRFSLFVLRGLGRINF